LNCEDGVLQYRTKGMQSSPSDTVSAFIVGFYVTSYLFRTLWFITNSFKSAGRSNNKLRVLWLYYTVNIAHLFNNTAVHQGI